MSMRTLSLLACLTILLTSSAFGAEPQPAQAGTKRALLIGINHYQKLPSLRGSINDIETMRHVLVTRWGFPPQHIRMLKDAEATRAGLLAALSRFIEETGPQDMVYIHYSGHGSQVEDLNGDEPDDHLDETLVPHDGRTGTVPDITDDELDVLFAKLKAKAALIVLDSCHSGTATRSVDILTRSVPQDTRRHLYRPDSVQSRQVVPLPTSRYVLMTGAAAHQEALDGPVNGRYQGFFSHSLSKSISTAGSSPTPRELFAGVEREMRRIQIHFGRSSMPEPQLEAPPALLDAPLLLGSGPANDRTSAEPTARSAWLEVRRAGSDAVLLKHGALLEAAPGSTWAIYPPGETAFPAGGALAMVVVQELRGMDALAKPEQPGSNIPDGARAIAYLPAPPPERVPIKILHAPKDRRAQIESQLRRMTQAELVESEQAARYVLEANDRTLQIYSADGLQVVGSIALDRGPWTQELAQVLSRSANASDLLTLENPSSELKINVRVAGAPRRATRGVAVVADTQPAQYHIRRPGEPRTMANSLQLEIETTADSYLTVVDVDSQGMMNLLFPNDYQHRGFYPDGRVRAGEVVTLPDSLQGGNHAGFHWDYAPPHGMDTIRVFASTDLETAQAIRRRVKSIPAAPQTDQGLVMTRAAVASHVTDLRRDLRAIATRGLSFVYDPTPPALTTPMPAAAPSQQAAVAPDTNSIAPSPQIENSVSDAVPQSVPQSADAPPADWTAASLTIQVEP